MITSVAVELALMLREELRNRAVGVHGAGQDGRFRDPAPDTGVNNRLVVDHDQRDDVAHPTPWMYFRYFAHIWYSMYRM